MKSILGLRHGHDAAAALVVDGRIVADAAEERFTRFKNDGSFPLNAIAYCLREGGLDSRDLDAVAIPVVRTPEAVRAFFPTPAKDESPEAAPEQAHSWWKRFRTSLFPVYEPEPSRQEIELATYLPRFPLAPRARFIPVHHHRAHAASALYTSGDAESPALVATFDGRGDDISVALWRGRNGNLQLLREWDGTASLAWFYAACTEALDWRHGSDEWKTMGLAPYGTPRPEALAGFHPVFEDGELVTPHDFGPVSRWPDHGTNHYHIRDAAALKEIAKELGREDFAASVQAIAEEQAEAILYPWLEREKTRRLCCAGGFFLNVKLNQKIWYSGRVDRQWIYPNPGDSGLPVGAALAAYHDAHPGAEPVRVEHLYQGSAYSDDDIRTILDDRKLDYEHHEDIEAVTARYLADNRIVAWFQGRMEAGPRALGHRSILMSPLKAEHKDLINACVKYREKFRPFCPSVLFERMDDYFVRPREEPFMVTSFEVTPEKKDRIPAVVHVDGTARPQTVRREISPRYHKLISAFEAITGEGIVLNTSFNIKGEPIIRTPREAIKCFVDTGLDVLVMGNYLLRKPVCPAVKA